MNCGIRAMPTFQMFRYGTKVAEFTGADEHRLRALLVEHGGPPTNMAPGTQARGDQPFDRETEIARAIPQNSPMPRR